MGMGGSMMTGGMGQMMGADMQDMMSMMQAMCPGAGGGMMAMGSRPAAGGVTMQGFPLRHLEGSLAFLRTELQITDAQTDAWTAFADAVRTGAKALQEDGRGDPASARRNEAPAQVQPGWPTLLERHETALAARLEMVRNIRPAAEALYQELDETQQRLASELAGGLIGAP
ncbi:Spy/CpxP family protein refolding chaperone [Faunimonas sp. B44]|uniref:Spy/CpxP family protein refolding chaperone n=1 Tax=Faunimonas sp. B44 TaxID=3461493 RepID=UPI004044C56E